MKGILFTILFALQFVFIIIGCTSWWLYFILRIDCHDIPWLSYTGTISFLLMFACDYLGDKVLDKILDERYKNLNKTQNK